MSNVAAREQITLREAVRRQSQTNAQSVIALSTRHADAGEAIQAHAKRLQAEHPGLSWSDAVRRVQHAQPRLHAQWREELADSDWI